MNSLKSIFVSNYMMSAMGVMMYAIWMLIQGGNPYAWSGVLLTTAPLMMMISMLMMFKNKARTSARFPLFGLAGLLGVGLTGWARSQQGASNLPLILAVAGLVGFLVYAYWYSSFGRTNSSKLKVGAELPSFNIKDVRGNVINAKQLTDRPAILIFYRGNWCPLCMAQIKEIVKEYQNIGALGVRVAFIAPQPHKNTIALAEEFGANFEFFTDEDNKASRALGIANPGGLPMGMQMFGYKNETTLPTVIITDQNGRVVWAHETDNYRIRPEPSVYIEVLKRHNIIPA